MPEELSRLDEPKLQPRNTFELFQAHFDQLLNPSHELILLAYRIDWPGLEVAFAKPSVYGHLSSEV